MENINLNSIEFNSIITREDILKYITQEEIYSFYMGEDIRSLGVFNSPLREDNIPSFALYFHKIDRNILMFYDFATRDCGDFVVLVMKIFNLDYPTSLKKIAYDLKITLKCLDLGSCKLAVDPNAQQGRESYYLLSLGPKSSNRSRFCCEICSVSDFDRQHKLHYLYRLLHISTSAGDRVPLIGTVTDKRRQRRLTCVKPY